MSKKKKIIYLVFHIKFKTQIVFKLYSRIYYSTIFTCFNIKYDNGYRTRWYTYSAHDLGTFVRILKYRPAVISYFTC